MSEGILNTLAAILFLIIFVIFSGNIIDNVVDAIAGDLSKIIFDFVIISIATFRTIRLISYDKMTRFIRVWSDANKGTVKRTIHELMICPWCSGLWSALIVVFLYYLSTVTWIFVFILAAAGVGVIIQGFVKKL